MRTGALKPVDLRLVSLLAVMLCLVAGATADGVRTCVDYTKLAREMGADAVMISPPRSPSHHSARR